MAKISCQKFIDMDAELRDSVLWYTFDFQNGRRGHEMKAPLWIYEQTNSQSDVSLACKRRNKSKK